MRSRNRSSTSSTTPSTARSSTPGCARSAQRSSRAIGIAAEATVFLVAAADLARADVGTAIDAFARHELGGAHGRPRGGQGRGARARAGASARRRRSRRVRRAPMPTGGPTTAPPTSSCCPRSTIRRPTSRSRRWPAALPVIASTKSGAAELLQECDAGLVCPSGDVAGLAAHMQALRDPRDPRAPRRQRAPRGVCRFRRRRSRCSRCSCTGISSRRRRRALPLPSTPAPPIHDLLREDPR